MLKIEGDIPFCKRSKLQAFVWLGGKSCHLDIQTSVNVVNFESIF